MEIKVRRGTIVLFRSDALITTVHPQDLLCDIVGEQLYQVAGDSFVEYLEENMPLKDGNIYSMGDIPHEGKFKNVIFVVDGMERQLRHIVFSGLETAETLGCKTVTIPMLRAGVLFGRIEKNDLELARELVLGVRNFQRSCAEKTIEEILFVYFENETLQYLLTSLVKEQDLQKQKISL